MAVATRMARPSTLGLLWRSTIGKKMVMAGTGLVLMAFLVMHMAGNLKLFFGPVEFNSYGAWLRTIGMPVLHHGWYLWVQRVVLLGCVVLHLVSAVQLSRRDRLARPERYRHGQRARASFATSTMRYGGAFLVLFVLWHILDLTVGAVNPVGEPGHPYQNVVADFQVWWITLIYLLAMVMLCLHLQHGLWSAAQTLGANNKRRDRLFRTMSVGVSVVLAVGFLAVPVAVMTGWVK